MFATTKDYLSVNYTNKQSEIITGVTNITHSSGRAKVKPPWLL